MNKYFIRHKNVKNWDKDPGETINADYFNVQDECIIFFLKSGEKISVFPARLCYVKKIDE